MHHVCDSHEWQTPINPGEATWCTHEAISDPGGEGQKEPLVSGSPAHTAVCNIVYDDTFLRNIPYHLKLRYANWVSTVGYNVGENLHTYYLSSIICNDGSFGLSCCSFMKYKLLTFLQKYRWVGELPCVAHHVRTETHHVYTCVVQSAVPARCIGQQPSRRQTNPQRCHRRDNVSVNLLLFRIEFWISNQYMIDITFIKQYWYIILTDTHSSSTKKDKTGPQNHWRSRRLILTFVIS